MMEIFHICFDGDNLALKSLLSTNPELVNVQNKDGETPLHLVCMDNFVDCAKILIKAGADIFEMDYETLLTPLDCACECGNIECTKLILKLIQSEDIDYFLNDGDLYDDTPLHKVCKLFEEQIKHVELLLLYGSDVNKMNIEGDTPLKIAERSKHLNIVSILTNFDINSPTKKNLSNKLRYHLRVDTMFYYYLTYTETLSTCDDLIDDISSIK